MIDIVEFLAGQQACSNNEQCPANASESFKRGYGAEYELPEALSHRSNKRIEK